MNIKSERVHELARQAARLTGQSQTSVVEAALTAYLEGLRSAGRVSFDAQLEDVRRLVVEFNAGLDDTQREAIRADLREIHDDEGLPR